MEFIIVVCKKLWQATLCSVVGLRAAWRYQLPFRLEIFVFMLAFPAALYLGKTATQKALLIFSLILVLIVEILNSAIETVVDRIGLEHNELSGRAKDLASAAGFLTILNAVIVWALIIF